MPTSTTSTDIQQDLAEHAIAIRDLGARAVENVIEIGRRLTEAKPIAGHGGFLPWLKREFGWTERTAQNFMRVYELSKTKRISDLNIPLAGLYLLAAPSTPEKARDEVLERAGAGEGVSVSEIKEAVAEQKAVGAVGADEPTDEPTDETTDETAGEEVDTTDDELEDEDEDEDETEDKDEDETEIGMLEEKVQELKRENAHLRRENCRLSKENLGLQLKLTQASEKIEYLKAERDQLRARIAELEPSPIENTSAPAPKKRGRPPGSKNKPRVGTDAAEPAQAGAPVASSHVNENSTAVENAAPPAPSVDDADLQSRSSALREGYADPGPIPEAYRRAS